MDTTESVVFGAGIQEVIRITEEHGYCLTNTGRSDNAIYCLIRIPATAIQIPLPAGYTEWHHYELNTRLVIPFIVA